MKSKKTKISAAALIAFSSSCAYANESLPLDGYSLTTGPVFHRSNIESALHNPANGARLVGEGESVRLGSLQVSGRYELSEMDQTKVVLDTLKNDIDAVRRSSNADAATNLARDVSRTIIPTFEKSGKGNISGRASIVSPILLKHKSSGTVVGVSATGYAQGSAAFKGADIGVRVQFTGTDPVVNATMIDVPIQMITDELLTLESAASPEEKTAALNRLKETIATIDRNKVQTVINSINNGNTVRPSFTVTSASAVDTKIAQVKHISVSASTPMTEYAPKFMKNLSPSGQMDMGLRLNVYQAKLYRQVSALIDQDGNSQSLTATGIRSSLKDTSGYGLDLGVAWTADRYRLGATVYNLNRPKFKYPDLQVTSSPTDLAAATTLDGMGKIRLNDEVVLKPHIVLEGSLTSDNKRWQAQVSYALNKTTDFIGSPQQNYTASLSYSAENFGGKFGWALDYLIPSVRLGYRENMVGTKLSTVSVGASWGVLNVDAYTSAQKSTPDTTQVPRSAGVSVSVAEKF